MKRELGIFERAQALTDELYTFNAIGVLRLQGGPTAEVLARALAVLQCRHPLLAVRLTRHQGCSFFEPGAPSIPLQVVTREGDDQWQRVVEQELSRRIDSATGPLLRCTYLQAAEPQGKGEIVLTLHHTLVDADGGTSLCNELLSRCAADGEAAVTDLPALPMTPPSEALLPPRYRGLGRYLRCALFTLRQMADEMRYKLRNRGRRQPPISEDARPRVLTAALGRDETRALVRRARSQRVSLNSVISAAMLLAVQKHLYNGQAGLYRYFTMANLRPYLQPPQEAHHLGSHFAMLRFTIAVDAAADLWQLAKEVNRQVHDAGRRGDKFASFLMSGVMVPLMFRLKTDRMATTAFSYTGTPRIGVAASAIRLLGLHVFVSNFGLGPEYTAQVRLFDHELWWDVVYLDTDLSEEAARSMVADTLAILQSGTEKQDERSRT